MVEDIYKTKDKVEHLLTVFPETRDSDKELWIAYNLIFNDLKRVIESGNFLQFKSWLLNYRTPVFESLSRNRRILQEQNPELRGDYYGCRKDEETNVRTLFREEKNV